MPLGQWPGELFIVVAVVAVVVVGVVLAAAVAVALSLGLLLVSSSIPMFRFRVAQIFRGLPAFRFPITSRTNKEHLLTPEHPGTHNYVLPPP